MTQGTITTKKVKTLPRYAIGSSLEAESASALKVDYGLAARTALQNVQQELATKEVEQRVRPELGNTDLRGKIDILVKAAKEEDNQEPKKRVLKMNVISGKTFGMKREGTKIMSIISVAGHQVLENLSEPSEITLIHVDIYADYLREKEPNLDSKAARALLTTGGPRLMRVDGHCIEIYGPYPILMNLNGINIYQKTQVTNASDQVGRIYIDPISTWTDMDFDRSDLIPTNIRLAAANQGAIYVTGSSLQLGGGISGRVFWSSSILTSPTSSS